MATTIEYNIKVNDGGATQTLGQLENELEGINQQLKEVEIGSDAFKDLSKKSQELTKDLEGAQRAITGLTQEDKIRGFQGSIDILAGSVAGLTGAVGLLGIENEEFEKYTAYAANAIAFSEGIRTAAQGVVDLGSTLQKSATAQTLFARATAFASTTMGKFKIALAATGIGAIVLALGLLITNFDKVKEAVEKASLIFPGFGAAVDIAKAAFEKFVEFVRPALEFLGILPDEVEQAEIAVKKINAEVASEAEKNLARAKAAGKSEQELFDLKVKLIDAELQALKDADAEKEEIEAKAFERELAIIAEKKRLAEEAKIKAEEEQTERNEKEAADLERKAEQNQKLAAGIQPLINAEDALAQSVGKVNIAQGKAVVAARVKDNAVKTAIAVEENNIQKLGETATALGTLGSVLDQESTAAKGFAVSAALINTYLGITEALKDKTVPNTFVRIASAIAVGVSGFKAVKNILATPPKSTSASGRSAGSVVSGTPTAPPSEVASNFAPTGISPEDAVAAQGPIRAYVVSGDITSSQEATAQIESNREI
jgi:hypothetical protein